MVATIIIISLTFIVSLFSLLNSTTNLFKKRIPIKFGFKYNDQIVNKLEVTSGDPEKVIQFRFINSTKSTLKDIIIELMFTRPLSLSGTNHALTLFGRTRHGPSEHNKYYLIRYFDLIFYGKKHLDFKVELNTKSKSPGDYKIVVNVYSESDKYKLLNQDLVLQIK